MILARLPERGVDAMGSGAFLSPRGRRLHKGIDYLCPPGAEILSGVDGRVTKLGYCYKNDLQWRYIEVTDQVDRRWRYFYVFPMIGLGELVERGDLLGRAQDIRDRLSSTGKTYGERGMKNHVHLEILGSHSQPVDPNLID